MTLGLGKILKGATASTNQEKMTNFPPLKPTTSGISKYSIKRMKRLAQGPRRIRERQAQVQGPRESVPQDGLQPPGEGCLKGGG